MKRILAICLLAGLLLVPLSALAAAECYTLVEGDYYGGNMLLSLTVQPQTEGSSASLVLGTGTDSQGDTVLFIGTTQSSGHIKEYSLRGSSSNGTGSLQIIYQYHLTLGPGDPLWTGTYGGEVQASDGSEKNVGGAAEGRFCN